MMTDEKQDLDNLSKHPGWQRFVAYATEEINTRLNNAMENAAGGTDDTLCANQLRQCIAVKTTIRMLLAWPESRMKVLVDAAAKREPSGQMSRRGTL